MLALVLALVIGAAEPTPARAAPAAAQQSYSITLSPTHLVLCVGQTATVRVTTSLSTRRGRGSRAARRPARGGWVSVLHGGGSTSANLGVRNGPSPMSFNVRGVERGTQTFHVSYDADDPDVLAPLVGQAPAAPAHRADATLVVTVIDPCAFDLTLVTKGTRRKGFVERLTSTLRASITLDQDGNFSVETDVVNRITQLRPIRGLCNSSVRVPASDATVEGRLDPETGRLDLQVSFSDIQVPTDVKCTTPRGPIERSSTGPAKYEIIEPPPIRLSPDGVSTAGTVPYTAYADIRITGVGEYTITPRLVRSP
jgi:hypothetical protein